MKRFLFCALAAVLLGAMAGTMSSCKGKKVQEPVTATEQVAQLYHDYDGVVQDFTCGVSQIQALHRQTMYGALGVKEFEWRNSRIVFNDAVTWENIDDLHVTDVTDVFSYWNDGPWTQFITSNVKKGVLIPWPINDLWIEDASLNEAEIKVSAEDALGRLKAWNGTLPKDCNFLTLRLPIGPKECNAQWVFGDVYDVLFIDAVTGEVKDSNPAFPE